MHKHHTYDLKTSINIDHLPKVRGYDFEREFSLERFLGALQTTGMQASELSEAIDIVNIMRREQADIFVAATSNMMSSGIREALHYLLKHNCIAALVITAGGIEEDIIKLLKPFLKGSFTTAGSYLFEHGINRTGNLFVPNDRYTYFEKFFHEAISSTNQTLSASDFIKLLSRHIDTLENKEESCLYWALKNNIPVFCPAPMDGSIGDLVHFHRQQHADFCIDVSADMDVLVQLMLDADKAGGIILGGGVAKHYLLNAAIFREGLDYTVLISTAQEFDGSDSGARLDESVSWGKVKSRSPAVKVHCDATIAFPLLMLGTFAK